MDQRTTRSAARLYRPPTKAPPFATPAESAQAPRTAASASAEPVTIEPTDASVYKASQVIYASQPELRLHGKGGPCFVHPKMYLSQSPPQKKAWTGKAQPPVATRGPMKAPPPVCRPDVPAATKLSPPICPETHPQPTPPLANHPCTDVADLLFDSDEECLELQHPLQRRLNDLFLSTGWSISNRSSGDGRLRWCRWWRLRWRRWVWWYGRCRVVGRSYPGGRFRCWRG